MLSLASMSRLAMLSTEKRPMMHGQSQLRLRRHRECAAAPVVNDPRNAARHLEQFQIRSQGHVHADWKSTTQTFISALTDRFGAHGSLRSRLLPESDQITSQRQEERIGKDSHCFNISKSQTEMTHGMETVPEPLLFDGGVTARGKGLASIQCEEVSSFVAPTLCAGVLREPKFPR